MDMYFLDPAGPGRLEPARTSLPTQRFRPALAEKGGKRRLLPASAGSEQFCQKCRLGPPDYQESGLLATLWPKARSYFTFDFSGL